MIYLLEILFRSRAIDILLALYEKSMGVRELINKVGGSATTVEQRLRELKKARLIEENVSKGFPFRRELRLTEKGKEVAKKLKILRSLFVDELPLKRMIWPLLTLYVVGEIRGKTKLQKLVFLLDKELNIIRDHGYNFVRYRYGPFSKELIEDVEMLILIGLVKTEEEVKEFNSEEVTIVVYKLTDRGKNIARKAYNELTDEEKRRINKLKEFNAKSARSLTVYVHRRYPEYVAQT